MYTPQELLKIRPWDEAGAWKEGVVAEYLIWACNIHFQKDIKEFFQGYQKDQALLELLLYILLADEYWGSDARYGAAYFISKFDREVLKLYEDKIRKAQNNEIYALRPFHGDEWE